MKKFVKFSFCTVFALCMIFIATGCKAPSSGGSSGNPDFGGSDPFNALGTPLTLEAIENGSIILTNPERCSNLRYKIDDGEFISVTSNSEIQVSAGNKVIFFGKGTNNTESDCFNINCTSDCYIYGNIMSLLTEDYQTSKEISQDFAFSKLFLGNIHIKNLSTKKLELPATTLSKYCYSYMFGDCDALISTPELPASNLADYCYYGMFAGCNILTNTTCLPAANLKKHCYSYMFYNCGSLITAPLLTATNLADYCYYSMFSGCTSLTNAPSLSATTLAESCYERMFSGCKSLTLAPDLSASNLARSCYSYMFNGCSSLSTAPTLSALELTDYCYKCMFKDCTSLTASPILPALTLKKECYIWMFEGCTKLNYITCLAKDISADSCTSNWVTDVSSTGSFIGTKDINWSYGISGIPSGWTVIEVD